MPAPYAPYAAQGSIRQRIVGVGGHSVFAGSLLGGLSEMDRNVFTAAELFDDFIREPVAGRVDQTPKYNVLRNSGHEGGDFVFVRVRRQ